MKYHGYQTMTHLLHGSQMSMTIMGEPNEPKDTGAEWKTHVYFTINASGLSVSSRMLPDEARSLAAHLISAADAAESEYEPGEAAP